MAQRNDEELSALSVDGKPVLLLSSTTNPDTGRLREFAITIFRISLTQNCFHHRFREFNAITFRVDRGQLERHPERDLRPEGPARRDRPGAAKDEQHSQVRQILASPFEQWKLQFIILGFDEPLKINFRFSLRCILLA